MPWPSLSKPYFSHPHEMFQFWSFILSDLKCVCMCGQEAKGQGRNYVIKNILVRPDRKRDTVKRVVTGVTAPNKFLLPVPSQDTVETVGRYCSLSEEQRVSNSLAFNNPRVFTQSHKSSPAHHHRRHDYVDVRSISERTSPQTPWSRMLLRPPKPRCGAHPSVSFSCSQDHLHSFNPVVLQNPAPWHFQWSFSCFLACFIFLHLSAHEWMVHHVL